MGLKALSSFCVKEETMCKHQFIKINDVSVCKFCGLTFSFDGKVMFDRKLPNICNKKKRRKK